MNTIPRILIQRAEEHGEKVAFLGPGWSKTYHEVESRSRRLAVRLVRAGARRGDFVAIVLDRCYEAVESVFAITRAGAVGVPLDSRSPPSELALILEHCRPRIVITDEQHLNSVQAAAVKGSSILVVTGSENDETHFSHKDFRIAPYENWARASLVNPDSDSTVLDGLEENEPAYLHYTSGTTGKPKGVLSSQESYIWNVRQVGSVYKLTSDDRWFWPLPLFHCVGHSLCIIATVIFGASAYLTPIERSPLHSFQDPRAREVTIMVGAPATFYELVRTAASTSDTQSAIPSLPSLRACMYAGAIAALALTTQVQELFGVPLIDNYGCTEASGAIATQPPDGQLGEHGSIKPLPSWEFKLVDGDGKTVENEGQGELLIRGPGLMLGYYKASRSSFNEEGWFPTGDIAVISNSTGKMTVVGRKRELIIRGGENIHPVDLECVLLRHPDVADVVVAAASHRILGEVPVAYIVKADSALQLDLSALLRVCREALPEYKLPAAFYEIDIVPRTLLGKPKRLSVHSSTCKPITLCSKLQTKDDIEAMVRVETAAACVLDIGETGTKHSWLRENFDQPFALIGLSSMVGVALRDRLASLTGLSNLPNTLVYDYTTPAAVSDYLCSRLLLDMRNSSQAAHTTEPIHQTEPIAIISMACRYPGGISSPEELWQLVRDEVDATSGFPSDRGWNIDALYSTDADAPGTSTTKRGGFLPDFADFDAGLFGMAPREAIATDPQQRLLLETTWELAERGGIAPLSLKGSQTGAYIGTLYDDYEDNGIGIAELEAHLGLGSSGSVLSGRISYCFGLHGPSVAITTGCSSSLVAVHQAAQGLRNRECILAIAGGVTTMATPRPFSMFSRRRGLSSDGRCRAYSSDASGTGWSEGIGLILLERLSDAKRNEHKILGLIRGSAINSDGASNGLTAPNGMAQQMCIRSALAYAGLQRDDVDVLEGHGTATPLGDPIEAQAVIDAYGNGDGSDGRVPRSRPLLLGSIKSNFGHTQAAAAVAGIIKMVYALHHGMAPTSLHIREPSSRIRWDGSGVELLRKARKWPSVNRPRRAAVSSFGIGGTNGHIILEQSLPEDMPGYESMNTTFASSVFPWVISGASEAALRAQAKSLLEACEKAICAERPVDTAFSLATARSPLNYRATINFTPGPNERAQVVSALQALHKGEAHVDVIEGRPNTPGAHPRVAFMFSGQGSRLPTMNALEQLFVLFPVFFNSFKEASAAVDPHLETPLSEVVAEGGSKREKTDFAQAILFVFEVAMFRLLESFNIRPAVVIGHSLGEIAAAHVSGAVSLHDAAYIVTTRAKLMAALPTTGGMVSVAASKEEVARELSETGSTATIAAVNSERSVVVSGGQAAIQAVAQRFEGVGKRAIVMKHVKQGFHSPMMDGILTDLENALSVILPAPGKDMDQTTTRKGAAKAAAKAAIPLISTVTGERVGAGQLGSCEHWIRHVREPVRFKDAISQLRITERMPAVVEVGPSAMLCSHVPDSVATHSTVDKLLKTVGQLWTQGVPVDWQAVFRSSGGRLVDLPVYAFQRQKFWLPYSPLLPAATMQRSTSSTPGLKTTVGGQFQGILLEAIKVAGSDNIIWSGLLSTIRQPWLRDHVIGGQWVLPASAMVEMALRAVQECNEFIQPELAIVREIIITTPLTLPPLGNDNMDDEDPVEESKEFQIQVLLGEPKHDGVEAAPSRSIDVYSRPSDAPAHENWTRHATGSIKFVLPWDDDRLDKFDVSPAAEAADVDLAQSYSILHMAGISYGPHFRSVSAIWRVDGENEILAQIEPWPIQDGKSALVINPAVLDGALHAPILASLEKVGNGDLKLPFSLRGVQLFEPPATLGSVLARICRIDGERFSVTMTDKATGAAIAQISEVQVRAWQPPLIEGNLYHLRWIKLKSQSSLATNTVDKLVRVQGWRGAESQNLPRFVHEIVAKALCEVQKWRATDKARQVTDMNSRLVFITERAISTSTGGNGDIDVAAAAVWGFVRSAQAEVGGNRIVLIDVDGSDESEKALPAALASKEEVLGTQFGELLVPSLHVCEESRDVECKMKTIDISGTVLISGGTGGLGAILSRHLAGALGAKSLLLVSRRGMDTSRANDLRKDLTKANASVRVESCDVSDRDQLAALLHDQSTQNPITAIIHCAGVVDDGFLGLQTPDRISRVLRSKVDSAWNLHELAPHTVRSFVMYSSYVGIVGNEGQAGYTAANAFIDGVARLRAAQGLPALSIAWGPWANEGGMAAEGKLTVNQRVANVQPITDQQGLDLFSRALELQTTNPQEPVLIPLLLRGPFPMVLSATRATLKKQNVAGDGVGAGGGALWRRNLSDVSWKDRQDTLLELLRVEIATILGYQGEELPHKSFVDLGFDSFMYVLLGNRMRLLTGLDDLPVTLGLDYDTPHSLAQYLVSRLEREPESLKQYSSEENTGCTSANFCETSDSRVNTPSHSSKESSTFKNVRDADVQPDILRGVSKLHRRLSNMGRFTAAADLLASAALAVPTFPEPGCSLSNYAEPPQRLAVGPTGKVTGELPMPILFIAPFFPRIKIGGVVLSVYSALAATLNGARDVFELPHPEGQYVPRDLANLAELHAETIGKRFSDRDGIVLAGYSAGGTVAYAVAAKLAKSPNNGPRLAGFVLLDTYLTMTGRGDPEWLNSLPAEALLSRLGGPIDMEGDGLVGDLDLALAKVGGYFLTLRDWDVKLYSLPEALPTLFVRAKDPSEHMPKDPEAWKPRWPRSNTTKEVPGSHLALLDKKYAPAVAVEIERWTKALA